MNENLLNTDIPEKFLDPETGDLRLDTLVRSYNALEKKMSQTQSPPASHEEYCIDCAHGLFQPDMDINKRMHEKGFTQEQAQEVYNMAAEKMVPMIMEIAADLQADREVEKLVSHFGGAEQWREVSHQLLAYGQKNLPPQVLDNMASSFEGVIALYRMMKGEEPSLQNTAAKTPDDMGEKELASMMRDPKYWKDRDPAFIAKVTQGFQKIYGK